MHNKNETETETHDKTEEKSVDGLLIALITISTILIVFLLVAIIFMCYKHNYCNNKNKTSPDEKKGEIKNGPDIERGEISNKQQSLQNINEKKNKNVFKIEKKIIYVQENPKNQKSPKMIVREKIKVLRTLTKKVKPKLIKERPQVPIRKMKTELITRIPQAPIRKSKSEIVKDRPKVPIDKPKISMAETNGSKLMILTESP